MLSEESLSGSLSGPYRESGSPFVSPSRESGSSFGTEYQEPGPIGSSFGSEYQEPVSLSQEPGSISREPKGERDQEPGEGNPSTSSRRGRQEALLDAVDEYLAVRKELDYILSLGHIHLAQAKYILSPLRMSAMSYDHRMKANTLYGTETLSFARQTSQKRFSKTFESVDGLEMPCVGQGDPISWFGLLPPQPLRSAQQDFRQSLLRIHQLLKIIREMDELSL